MNIGEFFEREWERESTLTMKMLNGIPEDRLSWKPHEKSKTLGALAAHVASMPGRFITVLNSDSFDPMAAKQPELKTKNEMIGYFADCSARISKEFANVTDEDYGRGFTFSPAGKPVFTLPKAMALNRLLFMHMVHHRAQLSVYLRLLDSPVPGMYGPSVDE